MRHFVNVSEKVFKIMLKIKSNEKTDGNWIEIDVHWNGCLVIFLAVVYEMLYKKVFKLPDIEYSVETMLHSDINHEPSSHEYANGDEYATHIVFEDGRKFQLDRPGKRIIISANKWIISLER